MSERRHTVNLILATVERLFEGHVIPNQKFREAVYDDLSCIDELAAELAEAEAERDGHLADLEHCQAKLAEAEAERDSINDAHHADIAALVQRTQQRDEARQQLAEAEAELAAAIAFAEMQNE